LKFDFIGKNILFQAIYPSIFSTNMDNLLYLVIFSKKELEQYVAKRKVKSLDEIKGTITLKACYYGNIDRVKDILEEGACAKSIQSFQSAKANSSWEGNKIRLLLEHNNAEILAINIDDLYDCKSIKELIEIVSYPFSLIESK
jgi:hypothetical protein